jgi:general secretion pathway protein F
MPLYQYKAIGEKGRSISATVDADSLQDAKLKLIRRQVAVFHIEELSKGLSPIKLPKKELLNLTREMGRLLQAGLPLFETLGALEEKYQGQKAHPILLSLSDQVKGGASLSSSLAKHPKTFDLLYTSMIANAEKTGRLASALQELVELFTRQEQVKKQLVSAFLYPAILSLFCLVVLSSLLFYVIPSLKELFDGRDLHPFTQIIFSLSDFACKAKIFLLLCPFALGGLFFWKRDLFVKAPFFKTLFAKVALARFSRAVATLLEGGLPLVQAFHEARFVMRHAALEEVITKAEKRISEGQRIAASLQDHPLIPPLVPRMIGIAEEGGKLPFMMRQIAEIYEEELEKMLHSFTNIAQPVLLLILGAVIGFVLLAVLLPLTDVSSFAT